MDKPFVPHREILAVAAVLAVLTVFLHGSALHGFWRFDDPWQLLFMLKHPVAAGYFFSPDQWRESMISFFTPWLILDYWLDFRLFGLQPAMFYAHSLLVIWLAALLTFVLLYRRAGALWSGMAAALFLAGAPVAFVSQHLMTRHYATGLVFAILSILFWLKACKSGGRASLAMSAVFYLLAMLNKEIFAPLPLVLLFLDGRPLKSRLAAMLPMALIAVTFVVWRSAMLGKVIGGYAGLDAATNFPASVAILPQVLFGSGTPALAAGAVLLPIACWALYTARHHAPLILAALAALLLPFLAIRASLQPIDLRLAFLPWWGSCVLLSLGFARIIAPDGAERPRGSSSDKARHLVPLAALIVFSCAYLKGKDSAVDIDAIVNAYDVQGRFMWSHKETESYIPLADHSGYGWYDYGINALKMHLLMENSPVAVAFAEVAVKLGAPLPVHYYDPDCRCMKKALTTTKAPLGNPSMPMAIRMNRTWRSLEWVFQAPTGATCFLAFPDINIVSVVPCSTRTPLNLDIPSWMRGRIMLTVLTAEKQWNTSPMLSFPEKGENLNWTLPLGGNTARPRGARFLSGSGVESPGIRLIHRPGSAPDVYRTGVKAASQTPRTPPAATGG